MASRIFWVVITAIALITGAVWQGDRGLFSWGSDEASDKTEQVIRASVGRAVDGSMDHMQVIGSDGREIEVSPEAKRAMSAAVAELVKAEADLAVLKIRDGSTERINEANKRRDLARTKVDRLKDEMKGQERAAAAEHAAIGEEIQREVREDVRAAIRDAASN
jgi:hypothetical protein